VCGVVWCGGVSPERGEKSNEKAPSLRKRIGRASTSLEGTLIATKKESCVPVVERRGLSLLFSFSFSHTPSRRRANRKYLATKENIYAVVTHERESEIERYSALVYDSILYNYYSLLQACRSINLTTHARSFTSSA